MNEAVRLRPSAVPATDKITLQSVVERTVARSCTVFPGEHRAYIGFAYKGYPHDKVKPAASEYGREQANGIESVWGVIKRGFAGANHHWSIKYMQAYVDEFTFRLHKGNVDVDTQDRLDARFHMMPNKIVTCASRTAN